MSAPTTETLKELAHSDAAEAVAAEGESALASALRRAREENDTESRSQHHSYNSHSSNPW